MSERISGIVKSLNAREGSGFIERQGGKDVFFHISAIRSDNLPNLREGQAVEFTIERGPKGPQATNIVFIK